MKSYLILIISLITSSIFSQNIEVNFIESKSLLTERFIGKDTQEASYYISNNTFTKSDRGMIKEYQNFALGKIANVDILNPLKIVLHYKNFNTIVLLDNQLNELQRINLFEQPNPIIVEAVGIAGQNKLWIYDQNSRQLGTLDLNNLKWQVLGLPLPSELKYFQTDYNYFYWIDSNNELFQMDLYGKKASVGSVPKYDQIAIINSNEIMYTHENQLYWKHLSKPEIFEVKIKDKTIDSFSYKEEILSIFTNQKISNYKIITP